MEDSGQQSEQGHHSDVPDSTDSVVGPVSSTSRRQGVIDELRRSIIRGGLKPGERLTELGLSKALGVSRPTVREALNQVAREGLVVQEPYRGLRVAVLDADEVIDIARVRMALDVQAATEILEDASGERVRRVAATWDRYLQQISGPIQDPLTQHDAHLAFHQGLWEAAQNRFLMHLWPATRAHMTIALAYDQSTRQDLERAQDVHQAIVDALQDRNLAAVTRALEVHTMDSARELAAFLAASAPDRNPLLTETR